ncbi:MAG TPA: ParB N-terminal domain-containing protein [Burkholderiaceae bacterium]|nr:ParB N-terminal domain-containing protein [Burkholderiaceae bacterium]
MTRLQLHPLCEMFPRINGDDLDDLRDDIKSRGLDQPIVLYEGQILDGRHRYDACLELNINPIFVEYQGDDPLGFVMAANVKRRHLTAGQQAQVGAMARLKLNAEAEAKLGPHESVGLNQKAKLGPSVTMKEAAKSSGVSLSQMKMATQVGQADPELAKEVINGEKTLPEAVEKVRGKRPGRRSKKPKEAPPDLSEELARVREERDQLAIDNAELLRENETMSKIIDADGDLAAAHKIIKELQGLVKQLESRIAGLQREKNAAISAAKSAQRKAGKK